MICRGDNKYMYERERVGFCGVKLLVVEYVDKQIKFYSTLRNFASLSVIIIRPIQNLTSSFLERFFKETRDNR